MSKQVMIETLETGYLVFEQDSLIQRVHACITRADAFEMANALLRQHYDCNGNAEPGEMIDIVEREYKEEIEK